MRGTREFGDRVFGEFSRAWLLLTLLPLLAYFNTFHHSFHYDDSVIWDRGVLFIDSYVEGSHYNSPFEVLRDLKNRSLLKLVFSANYHFSRLSPFGYHLANTAFHVCVAVGVFFLTGIFLSNLVGNTTKRIRFQLALTAALFFSVSPMATQGVTYIMGRSSSLATLLYILCLLSFYFGMQRSGLPSCLYFLASFCFFVFGLGIKEIIITAPAVAMLSLYFFSKRSLLEVTRKYLPALTMLTGLVAGYILYRGGFWIPDTGISKFSMGGHANPHLRYLVTQLNVIPSYYLRLLFFPFNLNLDPDFDKAIPFLSTRSLLSLAVVLFLFLIAFFRGRHPAFAFMVCWFFLTLAPTSSVIPLADPAIEHRVYLPSIGFFAALALLAGNRPLKGPWRVLPLLIVLLFSASTVTRNRVWKDGLTLWKDAAMKSPHKSRPFNNLGGAFFREKKDFQGAIRQYKKAIHLNPGSVDAHKNLASAYYEAGMMDEAIRKFEHVYFLDPKSRSRVSGYLGDAWLLRGNLKKAEKYFLEDVRWNPGETYGYMKLGEIYKRLGRLDKAENILRAGLDRDPQDLYLKFHMGDVFMLKKDYERSVSLYREVLSLSPKFEPAMLNLGIACKKMGRFKNAFSLFKRVLTLNPGSEKAHLNMGILFLKEGDTDAALREFQGSLKINPSNPDTYNLIGSTYFSRSDYVKAQKAFQQALNLHPDFPEARNNLNVTLKALAGVKH